MDSLDWQRETGRLASAPLEAALAAARAGAGAACARAAREAAGVFLARYLEGAGGVPEGARDDVAALLEAAAARDGYFARLREAARLLSATYHGEPAEGILDALKEIRLLVLHRASAFLRRSPRAQVWQELDPRLRPFVTHCTTAERARSIFACGALYSFQQCVARGLLSGTALGVEHLLDPCRCTAFVILGLPDARYYSGEKVANSHRKGWIDEGLDEDYQPSARLFFRRKDLERLPGYDDDGCHALMIRDEVSLDHLVHAVFPSTASREAALDGVGDRDRRGSLGAKCLVAPEGCQGDPRSYVKATNALVAERVREEQAPGLQG